MKIWHLSQWVSLATRHCVNVLCILYVSIVQGNLFSGNIYKNNPQLFLFLNLFFQSFCEQRLNTFKGTVPRDVLPHCLHTQKTIYLGL